MRRKHGRVPTLRLEPRGLIDGKAGVVAEFDTLPVCDVFVSQVGPFAGQIHLGESGAREQRDGEDY
jgi:hypothetical protein